MILPERLYYPLPDAAKKLDCTIQDVIHFGAIGAINICVYIDNHRAKDNGYFHLNMPKSMVGEIDDFGSLWGDGWSLYDVEKRNIDDTLRLDGYFSKRINGFFYINSFELTKIEFDASSDLNLMSVSTGSESGYNDCIDVNFLTESLSIDSKFLCVKNEDIYNFKEVTKVPVKEHKTSDEAPKTVAKKTELIIALLKLIPEFSDVDPYEMSAKKIAELIEVVAAQKGIIIPKIHSQTLASYLGRERKSRK